MRTSLSRRVTLNILALGVFVFSVFPVYWMVLTAFKPTKDIQAETPSFFPTHVTFTHFSTAVHADGFWTFWLITFPILRPMFGLILCLEVIWVFKCFVQIWAISQGGPGNATLTLPVYAYQIAQSLNRYDLGAAISMVTVLILAVVLLAYFRQMFKEEGEL